MFFGKTVVGFDRSRKMLFFFLINLHKDTRYFRRPPSRAVFYRLPRRATRAPSGFGRSKIDRVPAKNIRRTCTHTARTTTPCCGKRSRYIIYFINGDSGERFSGCSGTEKKPPFNNGNNIALVTVTVIIIIYERASARKTSKTISPFPARGGGGGS